LHLFAPLASFLPTASTGGFPENKYVIVSAEGGLYLLDTSDNTMQKISQVSSQTVEIRPFCFSCGQGYNGIQFENNFIIPTTNHVLVVKWSETGDIKNITCNLTMCSPYILQVERSKSSLEVLVDCSSSETNVDVRKITVGDGVCGVQPLSNNNLTSGNISSRLLLLNEGQYLYFVVSNGEVFFYTWPGQRQAERLTTLGSNCPYVSQITPFEKDSFIVECGNASKVEFTAIYSQSSDQLISSNLLQPHVRGNLVFSADRKFLLSWSNRMDNITISDISNKQNPSFLRQIPVPFHSNITSLCFLLVGGHPHIAMAVSSAGLFYYNISDDTSMTVRPIAHSNHACTSPGCIGLQSPMENYVVAGDKGNGATFYNLLESTQRKLVPEQVKVARMAPLVSPEQGPTNDPACDTVCTVVPAVVVPVLVLLVIAVVGVIVGVVIHKKRKTATGGGLTTPREETNRSEIEMEELPHPIPQNVPTTDGGLERQDSHDCPQSVEATGRDEGVLALDDKDIQKGGRVCPKGSEKENEV
jgi:hypothetical protein